MGRETHVYVCSKPLQYFNVRNLPKRTENTNILIIENRFKDAEHFYKNVVEYDDSWNEILFVENRWRVFLLCLFKYRPASFFYYLDWFLFPALMIYFLPCKHIYIYEEGFGSYRSDSFNRLGDVKKKIRSLLRISEYPGFHPRVKGMFVYCTAYYLKKFIPHSGGRNIRALSFNLPFFDMVEKDQALARNVFRFDLRKSFPYISSKRVALYITSWPFEEHLFAQIDLGLYDFCLIKPHPFIEDMHVFDPWKSDKVVVVESVILSEFLIQQLTDENNMVDIYHSNSSSVLYINEHPNIGNVINQTTGSTEFDVIYAGVQAECKV